MLGAHKLYPHALPVLPARQHASVREFLTLYRNGLPFIHWQDFKVSEPITHIILTDTQTRQDIRGVPANTPTTIIEHHPIERKFKPHETWAGELIGAATTLLVERIREENIMLNSLEATLMALGIYADTGMFTYGGTTSRDIQAAAWLVEHGAVLDTIRRFLASPLNAEQQDLFESLLESADNRSIHGYDVTVCTARTDKTIEGINGVAHRLRDVLDTVALFVIVAMPDYTQMVCRSIDDAIHVGEVARHFGGGGHPRAAASAIQSDDLEALTGRLWTFLRENIHPATRVADLMSYGVQTVIADEPIRDIIARLRRIGHEGYPVLDQGHVIGLLTLRDADKALEHGLADATVRDVMHSGNITLNPDDPVALLEQTMVASDWGQIPVIDSHQNLIGIVTRTDLIKHWVRTHPSTTPDERRIDADKARDLLGSSSILLIEKIATFAQEQGIFLYMVGGVVRDLLLERPNLDIDFVVEEDAIVFTQRLAQHYGGRVHSYQPFRTAKWQLDADVARKLQLDFAALPETLDFATARSELYEHPTALPTVYNSGIKLDLRRRDFTINTLAVQLSPVHSMWRILDYYGGIADLQERKLRVLHSLSFIDDPTRILRAVRFGERLQFVIESRTAELMLTALPVLRRITGERIQNELTLILKETHAGRALLKLEALGIPRAIHPSFVIRPSILQAIATLHSEHPGWSDDHLMILWHLMMADVPADQVYEVCRRLLLSENHSSAIQHSAQLHQKPGILTDPHTLPSAIDALLTGVTDETLLALWILTDQPQVRQHLERYRTTYKQLRPYTSGNTLISMGLHPGPQFRQILEQLRKAWLDGQLHTPEQEQAYLHTLIAEVRNDES